MESDSTSLTLIVAGLFGLPLSYSFFAVARVALFRSYSSRLAELVDEGYFGAKLALKMKPEVEYYVLATRIGLILSAVFLGGVALLAIFSAKDQFVLSTLGAPSSSLLIESLVVLVGISLLGILTATFAQVLCSFATHYPNRTLCYISFFLLLLGKILSVLVLPVTVLSNTFLRIIGLPSNGDQHGISSIEELSEILERTGDAGTLEDAEKELIRGVVSFADSIVREVMVPRKDIIAIPVTSTLEEVISVAQEHGYSRLVVIGEDLDDVKGVLYVKDLLTFVEGNGSFDLPSLMREPNFVQDTMRIDLLLKELRSNAVHFAIVVDEHGGVDGIVTLEDLIEEIVGDIYDEYDAPEEEEVREGESGELVLDASMHIDDVAELLGCTFPEGEFDTVAGFVIHQIGRIPEEGESIKHLDYLFWVDERDQNRITSLRVERIENEDETVIDSLSPETKVASDAS